MKNKVLKKINNCILELDSCLNNEVEKTDGIDISTIISTVALGVLIFFTTLAKSNNEIHKNMVFNAPGIIAYNLVFMGYILLKDIGSSNKTKNIFNDFIIEPLRIVLINIFINYYLIDKGYILTLSNTFPFMMLYLSGVIICYLFGANKHLTKKPYISKILLIFPMISLFFLSVFNRANIYNEIKLLPFILIIILNIIVNFYIRKLIKR